jgi:hypothetical protein
VIYGFGELDELMLAYATTIHNVPEWREQLVCSKCGSRNVDMVVTGTE